MQSETIEYFLDEGLISQVIRPLKHGKEASVHLCRSNPDITGHELVALKIYHPLNRRDFRDEGIYRDGEFIKERRVRVALEKKTKFGREVQGALWVDREWETLQKLKTTRVPAPKPIASTDDAILMTYIGSEAVSAPRLHEYRPDGFGDLEGLWRQLEHAIEHMLFHDIVHADLSSYNVLISEGEISVIDFPQALDPKLNQYAEQLLVRDTLRMGAWFDHHGYHRPWEEIAGNMWTGWLHADLIPDDLRVDLATPWRGRDE